ncbi:hypothetical protein [Petroclostridium sp. X23]|uniref:hypothetical protein n=1 Tax=Petroclostridium sp. X23 TaxID=3045146 RepID=UPI0032C0189B
MLQQKLLNEGKADTGTVAVETFDIADEMKDSHLKKLVEKIEAYFEKLVAGKSAVRKTLEKY